MQISRTISAALLAAAATAAIASAGPVDPVCEKLLPVAEVSKAYGKNPIMLFATGSLHWANSTCNYGHADDQKTALTVTINPAISDELYKKVYMSNPAYTANRKPVKGVGDEAYTAGDLNNIVMAKRGKLFVLLVSSTDLDRKTFKPAPKFSQEQLTAWAKKILENYR